MLDQNTDRMWYVIGAIVIGAAIIAMGLNIFSDSFDSVDSLMVQQMDIAMTNMHVLDNPKLGSNLITSNDVRFARSGSGDINSLDSFEMSVHNATVNATTGGLYFKDTKDILEVGSSYQMSYSYQVLDGDLVSFGGHTPTGLSDSRIFLDGNYIRKSYGRPDSMYQGHDDKVHTVKWTFKVTDEVAGANSDIWIQPNRFNQEYVKVVIKDLRLSKIIE